MSKKAQVKEKTHLRLSQGIKTRALNLWKRNLRKSILAAETRTTQRQKVALKVYLRLENRARRQLFRIRDPKFQLFSSRRLSSPALSSHILTQKARSNSTSLWAPLKSSMTERAQSECLWLVKQDSNQESAQIPLSVSCDFSQLWSNQVQTQVSHQPVNLSFSLWR